jgi:general secretion pathway protein A
MYERFYGLHERPFDLVPNPRFLLLTPTHKEALSNVEYGVTARRGITLLLGEAGTGKTTVLRKALAVRVESRGPRLFSMYLNNPTLTRAEFVEFLATQFGLGPAGATSKIRLLTEVEEVLRVRRDNGDLTVLVIDEAQSLPLELLEEVRLLANIESDTDKLLPLVLAGQPELAARLNTPELRQLKQRVALRCTLAPLSLQETAAYVAGRIRLAGGDAIQVFSRDAVLAIHSHARGIPRMISVICDNALLSGFATGQRPVGADLVAEVCHDFDLRASGGADPGPVGRSAIEPSAASNLRPFLPATAREGPDAARRLSQRTLEPK